MASAERQSGMDRTEATTEKRDKGIEPGADAAAGLTTGAAKSKLLELLDSDSTRVLVPAHFDGRSRSLWTIAGTALAVAALLLVNGGYVVGRTHEPRQTRGIGSIAEAVLLLSSMAVTWWVVARESRLETRELEMRVRAVSQEIRGWTGIYADLRTPQLPTVTTYTVLRDGVWRDVPTLLVVEGDTVALAYGEEAPCLVALRTDRSGAGSADAAGVLERGQRLTPDAMRTWKPPGRAWDPRTVGHAALAGRVLFRAKDTPLRSHLEQIARHHQRTGRSVLQNQMRVVIRLCALRVMPALFACALVANAVIYGVVSAAQEANYRMGVEVVIGKTVYVVFPFACTVLWPVLWIVARIFTNACEVVLFDTLQRSKTDYEDTDNIDEFDVEALPPTKDVTVGIGAIFDRMRWLWWNCDFRTLSRSSNLSETLGNVTVICSVDKEGTIAEPFCSPEQIVVPNGTDYAILDVGEQNQAEPGAGAGVVIVDEGWEQFLPSLRPLGLACCLNTAAHGSGGAGWGAPTHRRHGHMRRHAKIQAAQDTCLCAIGRAVGFATDDVARYTKVKEVSVVAPFHAATDALAANGEHSLAASLTATVLQPADGGGSPGRLQMLTDGCVDLVLGVCPDYFDGVGIRPLDDHTAAMYYSLYLNALQQDLQCLAFAYRPLAVDPGAVVRAGWTGWAKSDGVEESRARFVDMRLSSTALDAMLDEYGSSRNSSNSDTSVVSTTAPVDAGSVKKLGSDQKIDSGQTPGPDHAEVLADRPDDRNSSRRSSSEDAASHSSSLDDLPTHVTEAARKAQMQARTKDAPPRSADDAGVDYTQALVHCLGDSEDEVLRDAMSEQIFVGLATFAYAPKTDVCDFIEDLDVAGIRFVHFSRGGGRQSKAFAERLGLETDWNTCILLSSDTDGARSSGGGGYIEDHDIKARLPRGIESIRPHLADVDDIPLQISLFAECTAASTREMVRIFQENGDVVCCIGSALADSNTLTFAAADLAVGVEPIPHFNRAGAGAGVVELAATANDGSISTSGALVTQYALGAALTCLPCPLFLQHDTSLYMLMQVVSEARRLVGCVQQAAILLAGACVAIGVVNLVSALCLLPPAMPGYMVLWALWVVAPLLGAALLFAPHDENTMSTMPLKNHAHVADLPRFAVYAAVRLAPPVAVTVLVYVTALSRLAAGGGASSGLGHLSSAVGRADWTALTPSSQWAVVGAQTYALVAFVFHCVCVSATLMFRTRTTLDFVPLRNVVWVVASAVCLLLTLALAALLLVFGDALVASVPWYTYVLAFAGPLVLLPLQDLCKLHDKRRWTRLQKLAKLEFKTKLGLHSPL
ncbi:hypothetical protein GGH99_001168 [Coemansia sp. RSA 1285]|nr:hypothetical protein GGH99_001168 [Coemansia sp. RSA 1285]